jgi:hypothetical protein
MRCWKGRCRNDIIGEIHAQWTLVDFVSYLTCDAHWDMGMEILERRRVDGNQPVDVWIVRFDHPVPYRTRMLDLDEQP